ncbi:heavy-metal-associated domain-containing protein [Microbacterium sp. NPDC055903]
MNAAGRLGLYAAGAVAVFAAAFGLAAAIAPAPDTTDQEEAMSMSEHESTDEGSAPGRESALPGSSLAAGGYLLSPVAAPGATGEDGELAFRILDGKGTALTRFETAHEKQLHLIVVRSDGALFRHVHPVLDEHTGTWSLPWRWDEAGTYRVYADFTAAGGEGVTLSRTVEVAGDYAPVASVADRTAEVDGYTVTLTGDLRAGSMSDLTLSVARDGEPVTTLEPYLGAFGHLVALREGDLAYLHVHAEGDDPAPGTTAGPEIAFMAEAPTAGRYFLYLDFQIGGEVRTASFVVDASASATASPSPADDTDDSDADEESHGH